MGSLNMAADGFTKPLPDPTFKEFHKMISIMKQISDDKKGLNNEVWSDNENVGITLT